MKLSYFILSILFLLIVISSCNDFKIKTIEEEIVYYEFDLTRKNIYYLTKNFELIKYNTVDESKEKIDKIEDISNPEFRTSKQPFLVTNENKLLIFSKTYLNILDKDLNKREIKIVTGKKPENIYIDIEQNKLFENITELLNETLTITAVLSDPIFYIIKQNSGEEVAISSNLLRKARVRISDSLLNETKLVSFVRNKDFKKDSANDLCILKFKNSGITLLNQKYDCQGFYMFSRPCKFKLSLKKGDKKFYIRSSKRYENSPITSKIPPSNFITDADNNIYLYNGGKHWGKLIRITEK